jgi:steroid 5-alpha reductase family enzyme
MTFLEIFLPALAVVLVLMTLVWVVSVFKKNASIIDPFWGMGFILLAIYYYFQSGGWEIRKLIILILVSLWGLRLSGYLAWRNWGKGEDFRYRQFREKYGPHRYWWISFFQVFLLQGVLMWLISAPLLGAQYNAVPARLCILDILGMLVWLIGIIFEAGGDFQMVRFKADPRNRGKVLETGFWKYTRHPNYFGDSCAWWGYGLICLAGGSYIPVYGSVLMTAVIIRVSGVFLLERSLIPSKPGYREYLERTGAFFPWFPKGK